jgi:uncharacterized surface protein with fasciclin (FAS1) repeats
MYYHFKRIIVLLLSVITIASCNKKFDEYYQRPANLEPPIYQQLQAKGNFKNLLAAIDKAGYKRTLSGAGYWTFFAPHDSAFQVYFKERNISGIDQLDSAACQKIVTYCLVYNAFKKERIGDYQSNTGWVPDLAFRRRTANYVGVYNGKDTSGTSIKVINSNRNNNGSTYYVDADNNNKFIPYFVDNFMAAKALTSTDYNYFYPNTPYTGFNVVDAIVTEKDIAAENGVIHVVNKVVTALPSLDEYLESKPEYSEFRKLFDKFLVQYVLNSTVTEKYQAINGGSDDIYTKVFNSSLAFSPNNENYLKLQDNDGQNDMYTMFVPTNDVLLNYINKVLLEHYTSLDQMPVNIIYDFVNAHLWQKAVWPSKFNSTFNFLGEEARFDPNTNIVDEKILSNGIFYGTNKVQEANVFSSVYGKAYLDPRYSMMTALLNLDLKFQISNIRQNYTLFLISNDEFNAAGYFSDPTVSNIVSQQWRYTPPGGGTTLSASSALVRLQRILNLHVIPEVDVTSTAGSGVAMSYGGEFVKYNSNKVVAAGNVVNNNPANVTETKKAKNGSVHYLDDLLTFSENTIGNDIIKLGGSSTASPYYDFAQYLLNAAIFNKSTGDILNVAAGTSYTVFIPDNNAIVKAVNDGLLPGTGTAPNKVPNFKPSSAAEKQLVENFIYFHILNKKTVATDGKESGSYETLFKDKNGDATKIFVNNLVPNAMSLTDMESRISNIILASSNYLSNRCVIHLIDNYLKYIQ